MFPPSASAQTTLRDILTVIRGPASETARMDALSQLCDYLSVGTEESMVSFSIDSFVPPLVSLLGEGNTADIMLLAARALTHLMDALPASAASIAHHNAAPPLCANLLSIEYIDLAEQSLSALEKLSVDFPQPIVRAGGFAAALSFIDFFSTGVQRVAAVTACNMCRAPPSDAMDKIVDVLPAMMNLLSSDDQRIRESMMLGFSRLADSFKTDSAKIETLCGGGEDAPVVERVIGLIVPTSPPSLSPASYAAAWRLLATLSRGSDKLSAKLLGTQSLVLKLRDLLGASNSSHANECLNLADALLPEVVAEAEDETGKAVLSAAQTVSRSLRRRRTSSITNAFAAVDKTRRKNLTDHPDTLLFFGKTLLPTLLLHYNSSADNTARQTTLSVVTKFLGLAPAAVLEPLLLRIASSTTTSAVELPEEETASISPFIAMLLGENCSFGEKLAGLSLAHYALAKLPDMMTTFAREGVAHEMRQLKEVGEKEFVEKEKERAEKEKATALAAEASAVAKKALEESSAAAATGAAAGAGVSEELAVAGAAAARTGGVEEGASTAAASTAASAGAAGSSAAPSGAASEPSGNPAAAMMAAFQAAASSRMASRLVPLRHPAVPTETPSTAVASVAKIVVLKYLNETDDGNAEGDSVFATLTSAAQALVKAVEKNDLKVGTDALDLLAITLGGQHGISTFELSRSGIVDALVGFLKGDGLSDQSHTDRTCLLVKSMNTQQGTGAFSLLVTRVLGALAAEEKLPVCMADSSRSSNGSGTTLSSGLRQLLQPFKLCLRRASPTAGGGELRDYSHHVVLIEPMATMASVQDFLWQRVQSRGTSAEGGDPSSRAAAAAGRSRAGAAGREVEVDDMVLDEEHDDGGGDADAEPVDAMEDVPELGEDDDGASGEEDAMFEMDEDAPLPVQDGNDGEAQDIDRSDEGFSSGSEDMIGEDDDAEHDHDDMDGPPAFGGDQLATSLPPVELDHDSLAMSPRARRSGTGGGAGVGAGGASSASAAAAVAESAAGSGSGGVGSSAAARAAKADTPGSTSATAAVPRSYASALAAGMQAGRGESAPGTESGSGSRRTGSSAHAPAKLNFTLNGRAIPKDSSILQAVLQSRNDGVTVGPRLWSEIYTLVYSRASTAPPPSSSTTAMPASSAAAPAGNGEGSGSAGSAAAGATQGSRRSRRLSGRSASADLTAAVETATTAATKAVENKKSAEEADDKKVKKKAKTAAVANRELTSTDILERCSSFVPSLFLSDSLPDPVRNITCLLKHLHWMHSVMRVSSSSDVSGCLQVELAVAFMSEKINAKMRRQLSDPLALCGGVIPEWTHILASETSFLVPFETRVMLFQSTALGVPRALHMLQLRSDSSSAGADGGRGMGHRASSLRESEARMSRIQRQKVRIHRSRVLESAMRVMSMYASHGTVLEVEYFDEVGTGLGPTLEFYTLVSRELQRADLGLWRSKESVKNVEMKESAKNTSGRSASIPIAGTGGSASAKASAVSASGRTRRRSLASGLNTNDGCLPTRKDRVASDVDEFVVPTGDGLIPSCIPSVDIGDPVFAQKLSYFPFMGRFVAKAVSDGRLLDLRLSPVFAKLLLAYAALLKKSEVDGDGEIAEEGGKTKSGDAETGGTMSPGAANKLLACLESFSDSELWREFTDGTPGLSLLRAVDPQLASSLQKLLDMKGGVGDLCLSFVLPENEKIELATDGIDQDVTDANIVDYVAAVVRTVLCTGVRRQAEAFLRGFGDVIDVKSLLSFQANEIELLLCGPAFEEWSNEFLVQATRCDHGFRHESGAVVSLFRVLSELSAEDQRRFVLFATGSPALPVGGLMGLHPKLTIVKRTPEGGRAPDECLPTVMTCTNYFKLPDYSSYEVTKSRLLYALREGQGSFHLS